VSDYSLRGKCREMSGAAVADDPNLRLARGWYYDPIWGEQEHWWTVRPDGTIYDPTSAQFPQGGITAFYEEFQGTLSCVECGTEITEEEAAMHSDSSFAICSLRCYGSLVGLPV
jgi:hypothetical protein